MLAKSKLFYEISLREKEFADAIANLPSQLSIAVYSAPSPGNYIIDENTKAIFDEYRVKYGKKDVFLRQSIKHMVLEFFKRGRGIRKAKQKLQQSANPHLGLENLARETEIAEILTELGEKVYYKQLIKPQDIRRYDRVIKQGVDSLRQNRFNERADEILSQYRGLLKLVSLEAKSKLKP